MSTRSRCDKGYKSNKIFEWTKRGALKAQCVVRITFGDEFNVGAKYDESYYCLRDVMERYRHLTLSFSLVF